MQGNYYVIVGVHETGMEDREYKDAGGQYVVGPFDWDAAHEKAAEARRIFESVPPERFVYGEPFVDVVANGRSIEQATGNWYLKDEDVVSVCTECGSPECNSSGGKKEITTWNYDSIKRCVECLRTNSDLSTCHVCGSMLCDACIDSGGCCTEEEE